MNPFDNPEFREFVEKNAGADPSALRLKYHGDPEIGPAIVQIECRRKFARKLAETLSLCPHFVFPSVLAGEQATSDALASYHASLIPEGSDVTDLTSGLGIDVLHIARKASRVTAVERKPELVEALRLNAAEMGVTNVTPVNGDCVDLLEKGALSSEVAFIDPARRAEDGSRIFAITQYEPDVTALMPQMRKAFKTLFIKASPMLDITQTVRDLPGVTDIYAIGTSTECKELVARLDLLNPDPGKEPEVHAVTVRSDGDVTDFSFTAGEEAECPAAPTARIPKTFVPESIFIIEPYLALMKAAPLKLFAKRFGLSKIASNTHVYVTDRLPDPSVSGFGKVWALERAVPWASKNIKRLKNEFPNIDVAVRNFGMTADALRAKLGVKPGKGLRLLAVTDSDGNRLMLILREPTNLNPDRQ